MSVVSLTTTVPDKEVAEEIRAKLKPVLEEACKICDEALAAGLQVQFGVGMGQFGRMVPNPIQIAKLL